MFVDTPTDTPVDEVADDGGVETPVVTEPEPEPLSIDDLMQADLAEYDEFQAEEPHKGMPPLSHFMSVLDAPVRKHLANIRRDYSRKTQELAEARKEIEAERTKVLAEKEKLLSSPEYKRTQELANTSLEGVDLYSDEGIRKAIQVEAAKLVQEQYAQQVEALHTEKAKQEVAQLKARYATELQDPDVREALKEVAAAYPTLPLEDSMALAIQKAAPKRETRLRTLQAQEQERVRRGLIKTGAGQAPISVPDLDKMSETDLVRYLETLTPEQRAKALDIHKSRKRGY